MSGGWQDAPVVERAGYLLARARAWGRRSTASGLAVRGTIWLAGLAALVLALPPAALWAGPVLPVVAAGALLPAAFPRGPWVAVLEVAAIGAVAVPVAAGADGPSLLRLAALGGLLYLHHTGAALGAQLRTDAVVPPPVLGYWARRAGLVLAASAPVGLGVALLPGQAPDWPATGSVALGAGAALAAAVTLTWLRHR